MQRERVEEGKNGEKERSKMGGKHMEERRLSVLTIEAFIDLNVESVTCFPWNSHYEMKFWFILRNFLSDFNILRL